jgi:hypothetical protein
VCAYHYVRPRRSLLEPHPKQVLAEPPAGVDQDGGAADQAARACQDNSDEHEAEYETAIQGEAHGDVLDGHEGKGPKKYREPPRTVASTNLVESSQWSCSGVTCRSSCP